MSFSFETSPNEDSTLDPHGSSISIIPLLLSLLHWKLILLSSLMSRTFHWKIVFFENAPLESSNSMVKDDPLENSSSIIPDIQNAPLENNNYILPCKK